jgi:ATP-dependent Lhr-like helicase
LASDPLSSFTPQVREWFTRSFESPTEAQAKAWPAIAKGDNVLVSAPTGSGKTLAAFLWGLDRLVAEPGKGRLVYVSPLKALSYDVEKNLRAPLRGIGGDISVAIRTGDTPQKERQAMLRKPPDVLITTPESLYLMLTSRAREFLTETDSVIVDEIHAVAQTKRGAHLALTLERLEHVAGRPLQRIGLSATQRPLEEVGRFLVGPGRKCQIVDAGLRKAMDIKIQVPVDDMSEPGAHDVTDAAVGGQGTAAGGGDLVGDGLGGTAPAVPARSIWPAIYPELLQLVKQHHSTIVFVNSRRGAERLAVRLNELAEEPIARAHHGSLAREERLVVEDLLKSGELPCLVATSSLELGIDMGAVDLVIQVESPKSVTAGLQRIGRAGHGVGEVSRGRIFPKFRADLVECAVVAKRMRDGDIEPTVVPRNPLDVLAQQVVAATATGDEWRVAELHDLVRRAYPFAELSRELLDSVLDMLDGRYPSEEFAELRPRIVWDRVEDTIRARKGALQLAVTNAGTIPDRGLYGVHLPDGRRVGELDEEMVYEARPGQTFLLGASTWRIEEITRDRVIVTPAPGAPGAVPFWKGDGVGRPKELGEAIGAFVRESVDREPSELAGEYDLDERAARNLVAFLREQRDATRVVPSDRTIVIERFRDEIGDWRLCVLSPYGGRLHAAWALALSARIRDEFGLESDAIWSDDGIIVHLPDADEAPAAELVLVQPDELEELVVRELSGSALFGARFRENAARSLLLPRARPGKRTPLWQQRLKAQSLLEVAKRYGQFPVVLETYRECLRDVFDLPGLEALLRGLHTRELSLVEVETQRASPFASSLLFDYVATYMYEGDTPNAERRAAALSLDRDLLRELLGQEELRDLIDPAALDEVESDLQRTSERTRAANADSLHDVLRAIGDLTADEAQARCLPAVAAARILDELEKQRRAIRMRIAGEERWLAAEDAGLYRDALGAVPPGGLPEVFLESVEEPLVRLTRRYARTHGPFTTAELSGRYGVDLGPVLRELERAGDLIQGELRPGGSGREWCDPGVLRRLRRASLATLRKEVEPAEQRALARFLPAWQGVDSGGAAGIDRLRELIVPLQGLALAPEVWERDVLPRRVGSYSPAWIDQLCASGELVWVGAGALGRRSGRVVLYFRDDARFLGPPPFKGEPPSEPLHDALRERLGRGAAFWTDLLVDMDEVEPVELQEALWDLAWAGEVTNDAFAPLRAPRLTLARQQRDAGRRFARRRRPGAPAVQGRWSLTAPLFAGAPEHGPRMRAIGELLLERYGIVTRETVLAEGIPGGFAGLYGELSNLETLGTARRGYFVEGLGGAQFALPAAIERLRTMRTDEPAGGLVLAATDPANPYGATLPWPKRDDDSGRRPARVPGAYVVTLDAEPVLYVERGGKGLVPLRDPDEEWLRPALEALADAVRRGRVPRLGIERFDGAHVVGTATGELLVELGFRQGPRKLTLSA